MYEIREYEVKDREQVTKLWLDICVVECGFKEWEDGMKQLNEDDYERILVVEFEGKIVGTMAYKKINDQIAELKRVYLYPEHRGMGIAQKLYNELLNILKENQYKKLVVETWENFQNGIKFYYKNNFELKIKEDERYVFLLNL